MNARQNVNLRIQRTKLIELASIRTDLLFRDQTANFAGLNLRAVFTCLLLCLFQSSFIRPCHIRGDLINHLLTQFLNLAIALQLALDGNSLFNGLLPVLVDICLDIRADLIQNNLHLRLRTCGDHFLFDRAQLLDTLMTELKSLDHLFFTDLLGAGLNHVDGFLGAGNGQSQCCTLCLFNGRIDNKFPVNLADDHARNRTVERNIRNAQCQRRTEHCSHAAVTIRIQRKHRIDNLNLVAESLRKQRTNRTVNQTRRQRRMLRRTSFTTNEVARNRTLRIHLLVVENRQRKEICVLCLVGSCRRRQNNRVIVADQYRPACLFRHLTVFNSDCAAVEIPALYVLSHLLISYLFLII